MSAEIKCSDCRWFVHAADSGIDAKYFEEGVGVCHRYPPVASDVSDDDEKIAEDYFPCVHEDAFCGEFKRRVKAESKLVKA